MLYAASELFSTLHAESEFRLPCPDTFKPSLQTFFMIQNYLKIAWRNLLRHKSFSLINIMGLAGGIAACIIIFLYVHYELTYDRHNTKIERIVRVTAGFKTPDGDLSLATSPTLLATVLLHDYPEVESVARLEPFSSVIKANNQLFREQNFYATDPAVFSIFDFTFKQGSPATCLKEPNTIVLTESTAKKYFGNSQAIGKTLVNNERSYTVTAIIANPPANSDIKPDALLATDFSKITTWAEEDFTVFTFVLFRNKPDLRNVAGKLARLSATQIQPELDKTGAKEYHVQFGLEPLAEVHFSKGLLADTPKGNKQVSYIFSLLAVFILVIAILNYINLSTAKATERAREVGVRKVNGARRAQLIGQFLFESLLLISIAWVIAFGCVLLILPLFNSVLETGISFSWRQHAAFMAITFLVTSLLAGLYPAFVLSGFKPVEILKGKWRNSRSGVFFRKTLTVIQFVITACLVTGAIVIYSQMRFIRIKDLGFTTQKMISISVPNDSINQRAVPSFVHSIESLAGPGQVTVGSGMNGDQGMAISTTFAETEEGTKRELMSIYQFVDKQFVPLFKIRIKEGRNLSDSLRTDKNEAFLVNEAFVEKMGWKKAIGKTLEGFNKKGKVVGVVRNYYFRSLHNLVEPIVISYNTFPASAITTRTEPKNISAIENSWKAHFPALPFEYVFLDEAYAAQYKKDKTTQILFSYFTFLAIFISGMGLYGLVSLMTIQRTKEIGVRKVLGASLHQLVAVLTGGFMKLIVLASLIALPIAGIALRKWLSSYAYHISIEWWMFLLPVLFIIIIALSVIGQQVLKAALANPVAALRNE
jgi:putative ABC transport system permease protein